MITLNRRQFLATSAAFSGLSASTGFAGTPFATLTAQQSDVQLLPGNYGKTSLWCFDGGSPGPEICVAQGGVSSADWSTGFLRERRRIGTASASTMRWMAFPA